MNFNQTNQNAGDVNNTTPADPTQGLRTLVLNAWRWGIGDFAKRLGKTQTDCERSFVLFQEIASRLRRLDDEVLAVITTPDKETS